MKDLFIIGGFFVVVIVLLILPSVLEELDKPDEDYFDYCEERIELKYSYAGRIWPLICCVEKDSVHMKGYFYAPDDFYQDIAKKLLEAQ